MDRVSSNLKVVSTEMKANGEAVQLVRPINSTAKSADQIVGDLVNRFNYKTNDVKASDNELNAVHQAFGLNLAKELIKTYDGSNLVSDSQQDLIGERYLAEQIRLIQEQQKTTSILDKWSHLLYEGENPSEQQIQHDDTTLADETTNSHYNIMQNHQIKKIKTGASSPGGGGNTRLQSNQRYLSQSRTLSEAHIQQNEGGCLDYDSQMRELAQLRAIEEARQMAKQAVSSVSTNSHFQKQYSNYEHEQSHHHHHFDQYHDETEPDQQSVMYQQVVDQQSLYDQQSVANNDEYQTMKQFEEMNFNMPINSNADLNDETQHIKSANSFRGSKSKFSTVSGGGGNDDDDDDGGGQQPNSYLPRLSSSHLNTVSIEDYNTPQFRNMLDQLMKPIILPPEHVNYPADWPSQDKINLLAEPIYIPAPLPIVIPAPNIITLQDNGFYDDNAINKSDLPEEIVKSKVTYYPSISNDQANLNNFGIRQINLNSNLTRTGSNLVMPSDNYQN